MKRLVLAALAASSLATAVTPALAQPFHLEPPPVWGAGVAVSEREANISQRIDSGISDGSLTRDEAWGLRSRLNDIQRLEARYRYDGLSGGEQQDLLNRLQDLSQAVYDERHDWEVRRSRQPEFTPPTVWDPGVAVNEREANISQRIDSGISDGSLTRDEAWGLRSRLNDIQRLEARYRYDGLSGGEQQDLLNQLQDLSQAVYNQRHDWEVRRYRR